MQLSPSVSPIAPKSLVHFQIFQQRECGITCQDLWEASASSGRKAPSLGEALISTSSPSHCRLAIPQNVTCSSKTTSPLHAVIIFSSLISCFHGSPVYVNLRSPEDIRISYYMQFLAHTEW